MRLGTRAVGLQVAAGTTAICDHCLAQGMSGMDAAIKFSAKKRQRWVICNVYASPNDHREPGKRKALPPGRGGVWDRVETFHQACYEAAGRPFGPEVDRPDPQLVPEELAS